ncbi:MAG: hypothetical protein EXX96DRAFT_480423, partial [Benjaminiella poitrasii]
REPSEILESLFNSSHHITSHFLNYIRQYDAAFAFTTLGTTGQQCNKVTMTNSFMPFQVHGELYHLYDPINSDNSLRPSYAQLYIYDPNFAFQNRIANGNNAGLDESLLRQITFILHYDSTSFFFVVL